MTSEKVQRNLGVPWDTPLNPSFSVHCADVKINPDLNVVIYVRQVTTDRYVRFYRLCFTEWSGIRCTWEGRFGFPSSFFVDAEKTGFTIFTRIIENSDWLEPPDCPTIPEGTKHYYIATYNNVLEVATHAALVFESVAESEAMERNLMGDSIYYNVRCNACGGIMKQFGWGQCPHPEET